MKKTLSAILATAMLITALPMSVIHAEENDAYFTEERTVNYDSAWKANDWRVISSQTTNPDYTFTVKNGENNESFSLLEVDADGTASKYFVIANQTYGKRQQFAVNADVANYWKNPTTEEKAALNNNVDSIAAKYNTYWLDGQHFEKGWSLAGPSYLFGTSPLISYIDNSHVWTCEPTPDVAVPNEKYTFTAGIALPSASEINTYADRFGIAETGAEGFATRTMINYNNGTNRYIGVAKPWSTKQWYPAQTLLPQTASLKIRPVCWLNDEFFANVPVDLATAGAAVKQEIKKQDVAELLDIYKEADLETYLGMDVYAVTVETLSGEAIAYGETLKAIVDGKDSSVTWQRVDSDGNVEEITTGAEYIVTEADMGYSIQATDGKVTSTPVAIATLYSGNPFAANNYYSTNRYSPDSVKFKVKDNEREFVLAKTFNNKESKYYVVANETYGRRTATASTYTINVDGTNMIIANRYDPQYSDIANWVNSSFPVYGNDEMKIPEEFLDYINYNHIWRTEGRYNTGTSSNGYYAGTYDSYCFTAGVTIPSMTEVSKYASIGYYAAPVGGTTGNSFILSRTGTPNGSTFTSLNSWNYNYQVSGQLDLQADTRYRNQHDNLVNKPMNNIRPQFYLKDGFFANVAIDLKTAGADVLEEIKKEDIDALRALYTDAELTTYLGIDLSQYPEIKTYSGEALAYGETVYSTVLDATWKINNEEISVLNNSYIITEADAGKTIAVEYAKDGKVYTNSYDIPALENAPHSPNNAITASKESENIIKVDGRSFTVVDDFNNKKSTFFVVANEIYGNYGITSRKMDPVADGNVMKYLNGTFKTAGTEDGKKLPQNIINYIDNDHIWLTEGTPLFTADPMESYTFTAGISIPSTSEIKRYKDTFGWYATAFDGAAFAPYWTRTAANHATGEWVYVASGGAQNDIQVVMSHWKLDGSTGIRPEFYLNEDFFRNVAIDNFSDLTRDSALTKMLTSRYSMEEMYALYGPKGQDIFDKQGLLDLGFVSDGSNFEVTFKNADNSEFDTLEGQTEICAEIAVTAGKKDVNTVAIFALYDDEERLVATNFANVDVAPGESKNVPVKLTGLSNITSEYTAKVMFVKDLLTLAPNFDEVSFIEANINSVKALSFDMGKETDNSAGGYNFF